MRVDADRPADPVSAPDPAAAAIADRRRWGPALEEWARASRGGREPEGVRAVTSDRPRIGHEHAPLATSVGTD